MDISLQIAEKLKDPNQIFDVLQREVAKGSYYSEVWPAFFLGYGWPGIAIFFGALDSVFPDAGWDAVAYHHLKQSIQTLEKKGHIGVSLYQGLSGLCYATLFCSRGRRRYTKLLDRLDSLLLDSKLRLEIIGEQKELNASNVSEGLSGIIAYLCLRPEDPLLLRAAKECLEKIIAQVSAISEGNFATGIPYGLAGVLAALSLAKLEGISVPGLQQAVIFLANWLKKQGHNTAQGVVWHHTTGLNEPPLIRDAWCYGVPSIARSLYLASRALDDITLACFAEESLLQMFFREPKEWNLMGPSFSSGRAGLLAITYLMASETKNHFLATKVGELESDLKRFYHPSHPFGFQAVNVSSSGEYSWVEDPGLLDGAAGIALTLLMIQRPSVIKWGRIFLIQ